MTKVIDTFYNEKNDATLVASEKIKDISIGRQVKALDNGESVQDLWDCNGPAKHF